MTEETQQNKIDLVKKMVFEECLNNDYIRKHKKENRYIPNKKKKDLLKETESLIPANIYNELNTYDFDIKYVYKLILLTLLYKLANKYSLKLNEEYLIKSINDYDKLVKYFITIREHINNKKEERKRKKENNFLSNKMEEVEPQFPKLQIKPSARKIPKRTYEYPVDLTEYVKPFERNEINNIMKNNAEYSSVFNLGNKRKILVRNPQLMDPRNAARYVKKGYKLSTNQDWDNDGVNDVVLLDNNNKIRSFNGYEQRPSDWVYKQKYYKIPKTERPTYKEFIDNDIYGQEIDKNNWEYKQNTQHIAKGWKQPKSSKIPSANKLFEQVIILPVWKGFYNDEDNKDFPKISYVEFKAYWYRRLVLQVLHEKFFDYTDDENMKKLQDKIKNLKEVKMRCLEIVQSLINISEPIGILLYNDIAHRFNKDANLEEICKTEIDEICAYIEATFNPPSILTEAIQQYIDQNDKLKGIKLDDTEYNIEGSKSYIPYLDGNKSSMKYTINRSQNNQWIRNTNNEDLKEEDLE